MMEPSLEGREPAMGETVHQVAGGGASPEPMELMVRAAGGVVVRREEGGRRLAAVVHRPRYDD